jgi:hypothetical protein
MRRDRPGASTSTKIPASFFYALPMRTCWCRIGWTRQQVSHLDRSILIGYPFLAPLCPPNDSNQSGVALARSFLRGQGSICSRQVGAVCTLVLYEEVSRLLVGAAAGLDPPHHRTRRVDRPSGSGLVAVLEGVVLLWASSSLLAACPQRQLPLCVLAQAWTNRTDTPLPHAQAYYIDSQRGGACRWSLVIGTTVERCHRLPMVRGLERGCQGGLLLVLLCASQPVECRGLDPSRLN